MHIIHRIIFALLLFGAASVSAAPGLLNYQGRAVDITGAPITTPVNMTFALFDVEQGSTPLWTETHQNVTPVDGVFSILLGSIEPFPAEAFDEDQRWLEISIAGETLEPRQRLASTPWAIRAGCTPGDILLCYQGDPATLDKGTCAAGRRVCDDTGAYGACIGDITPTSEVCVDNLDNDCDGIVDNGCGICGNGVLDNGEACDDGNLTGGDGCSANCQAEICGNGIWDVGEECDDGNTVSGDGCSETCTIEDAAQIAPTDANFNSPLDIQLDNTASVLDFISYPGGDRQDRSRYQVLGMNSNPVLSGGQAQLIITVSCFGNNIDQVQILSSGNTFGCGQTIVDRIVTADTDTGTITITAIGGTGTYVQWILTGTATRTN